MKLKINVTKENIENGVPRDSTKCPVALALEDLGFEEIIVDKTITFNKIFKDYEKYYNASVVPDDVGDFIREFDDIISDEEKKNFNPFTFNLTYKYEGRNDFDDDISFVED